MRERCDLLNEVNLGHGVVIMTGWYQVVVWVAVPETVGTVVRCFSMGGWAGKLRVTLHSVARKIVAFNSLSFLSCISKSIRREIVEILMCDMK